MTNANCQDALNNWQHKVAGQIEQCLTDLLIVPCHCEILLEAMRYSTLDGGKRIRPLLTTAAGELSDAHMATTILIGSAIELIHCFSLIHDDLPVMDNDDLRRGRPTNHKIFGEAVALLSGDALHALAFAVLSSPDLNINSNSKLIIINLLAKSIGIQGMVAGQTLDLLNTSKLVDLNELKQMHLLKTGALLRTAILAGYLAGTAIEDKQYQILYEIATQIGLLFQIIDDIIDATEDTLTLGKTANKDQKQAKATYVNLLGLTKSQNIAQQLHSAIKQSLTQLSHSSKLIYLTDTIYYRKS